MIKTTLAILLLLNSSITFALDYELINFANNRLRSESEILDETGKTRVQLASFQCFINTRNDLFTLNTRANLKMDSLRVKDSKDNTFIYRDQKLYRLNGSLYNRRIRDSFLKTLMKTLSKLEMFPESKQLINELQASPFPFVIEKGGNRYDPSHSNERSYTGGNEAGFVSLLDELQPIVERFPFKQIGYGGRIYWNPATVAKFVESDYKEREVNVDIILAHEMYHAYDGMRGLLDRRFIKADELEFQPVAEYRAVRFENIMRKNYGGLYRRFYSTPSDLNSIKDMLDKYEEPIVIPTPCIKWL